MNPTYDFSGQVALVTGASSGMGLATAEAFSNSGAAVVLADINEEALRATAEKLTSAGRKVLTVVCDVSDEAQVARMIERTVTHFGRLDMAFNNAGIQVPPSDAADETAENFDRVNGINLRGVWACMKHEFATDADAGKRSHRELLVAWRSRRIAVPRRLSRLQARRHRTDEECGDGVRATRYPDQRDLPWHDQYADGLGHAGEAGRRLEGNHARPADRAAWRIR
ncbi:NAD(P)-dependent dehydrogenase (short-subunit alcohol dehydrogenase family) [Bradyrhizobium sp. RT4b]